MRERRHVCACIQVGEEQELARRPWVRLQGLQHLLGRLPGCRDGAHEAGGRVAEHAVHHVRRVPLLAEHGVPVVDRGADALLEEGEGGGL